MGAHDTFRGDRDSPPRIASEVGLVVYPDCQLSAIHGLTDIFRIASEYAATSISSPPAVIRVSHWAAVNGEVECTFDSHPGTDHALTHVISPPSLIVPEYMTPRADLRSWMLDIHAAGTTVCAVCAGVFVLADAGLLDDRDATTHWAFADELSRRYPAVRVDASRMVVDDVDIITAAGILAWVDLGLTLVERLLGPSVMLHTSRFILSDPPRREQRLYSEFVPSLGHGDSAILQAQQYIHAHSDLQVTVRGLAEVTRLQPRTLQRRFRKATGMSVTEYLQGARIAKARESLELTQHSVEQISMDSGYLDASTFRRLFQRTTGVSPSEYRKRFGIART
ncbi:GlxA family transcriptional regulator [Antrihabitans cavernicola]|uniref:GlxA family transcriptional regulator n=1 Tax=Antrihabitans cavernicola TaxID=2495913 RepID=A0A5A7S8X5_9NOCA|nr:GlxA family transcriptional regulator [Spelaeibacter cavernicola]KAA0021367.1 GlxA family transcriptional regulator [Spelaeibacter cavernicola]